MTCTPATGIYAALAMLCLALASGLAYAQAAADNAAGSINFDARGGIAGALSRTACARSSGQPLGVQFPRRRGNRLHLPRHHALRPHSRRAARRSS